MNNKIAGLVLKPCGSLQIYTTQYYPILLVRVLNQSGLISFQFGAKVDLIHSSFVQMWIDFVPVLGKRLIQVCETLTNEKTLKRETGALIEAMPEMNLNESTIVTRNESEIIATKNGSIRVIPAWQFLLEMS